MTKEELREMIKASIVNEMHCSKEVREQEEEIETEETEVEDEGIQLSPEEQEVQTALEKALDAAKRLGNPKLVTQIGNTITFFTRSEIIKEEQTEEDIRSRFLRTLRMP